MNSVAIGGGRCYRQFPDPVDQLDIGHDILGKFDARRARQHMIPPD